MGSEYHTNSRRNRLETHYTHNPYNLTQPFDVVNNHNLASKETCLREVAKKVLPEGTMRVSLTGRVPFIAFPDCVLDCVLDRTRQRTEAPPLEQRPDTLVQVFFGQLPYKVSDSMIVWLCDQFAESDVLYIERVMQDKSRKGCMQVFVDEESVEFITSALNKRVLFDATGVWQAQNEEQVQILENHCKSEMNRYKGLPFRPMVVERSTSTYVRRRRAPAAPAHNNGRSRSATPPPMDNVEEVIEVLSVHEPEMPVADDYENSPLAPPCYFNSSDNSAGQYEPGHPAGSMYPCQCEECLNMQAYIPCEGPYRSVMPAPPPQYQYPPAYDMCYEQPPAYNCGNNDSYNSNPCCAYPDPYAYYDETHVIEYDY